jgi:hypothetical protein
VSDPITSGNGPDPRYIAARRVLLDALFALAPHGPAVVVAGAQAIYLRTGHTDISVAPYTTDADLALDPSLLGFEPALEDAMGDAGFVLMTLAEGHVEPGIWEMAIEISGKSELIPVDLIVPERVASSRGRRGARLEHHGKRAARRILGLEAVLVDRSPMTVTSLDPADSRSIEVAVAGVAALLVAKAHKVHDRLNSGNVDRIDDKDAADIIRIMQTTSASQVNVTLIELAADPVAGQSTRDAMAYLNALFGRRGGPGTEMAARALRVGMNPDTVEVIATSYIAQLTNSPA